MLWLYITTLCACDWLKNLAPNQSEIKLKPIASCSHVFSRAWRRLHVFASRSDWFIGLSKSVVIGQRDFFGFGFRHLMKASLPDELE